jgi:predicted RNA-binding protein with TRAM domain
MEISDQLVCLFSASIEERNGSYVFEVPKQELDLGPVRGGETYRVAILPSVTETVVPAEQSEPEPEPEPEQSPEIPPVEEGDSRRVEIEDIGEQGDGITRVDRGYVVIVPDTEMGEQVQVEITDVRANVAFGEVTERLSYYD